MALFKRADLKAQGFSDEQIEYIMTESGRSLSANYTLTSDVQAKIDEALKGVQPQAIDVKTTPEFMEVQNEVNMLRAIGGEDFEPVKGKFRQHVWGMMDHSSEAKPINEQLVPIREKFPEFFVAEEQPNNPKPQFGSPDQGQMPKGKESAADEMVKAWGFKN